MARRVGRLGALALGTALALVLAAPVFAHVSVEAADATPGAETEFTVRVPNESDSASTTRVEVRLPDGFEAQPAEPPAGWEMTVADGVLVIEGGAIAPGEEGEFAFTGRNPDSDGVLSFPAIQTYDDGTVARWIGASDSDAPAPTVAVGAAAEGAEHEGHDGEAAAAGAEDAAATGSASHTGHIWTAILIPGALALVLGTAAFFTLRRRSTA